MVCRMPYSLKGSQISKGILLGGAEFPGGISLYITPGQIPHDTVVPQPLQTWRILVAAEVGVADKMAKKWPFTSLVVLTAHLAVFNRFWMLFCWKKGWSLAWVAERFFFLRSYFHFRAEAADLAGCSKVYHEVMSFSRTKGERDSPFNFIQMLSYV